MFTLVKWEIKKIFNAKFILAVGAILLVLMQETFPMIHDRNLNLNTIYVFIISCDLGLIGILGASLCVIPYGFQFCDELNSHYYRFILTRKTKRQYICSRFISSGFASMISIVTPTLIYIIILNTFFCRPENCQTFGLSDTIWGPILKSYGDIGFFVGQLLIASIYAFTMGSISAATAAFTRDRYATIASPFIVSYFSIYISQRLGLSFMDFSFGFFPTDVSMPTYISLFAYCLLIISLSFMLFFARTGRNIENE